MSKYEKTCKGFSAEIGVECHKSCQVQEYLKALQLIFLYSCCIKTEFIYNFFTEDCLRKILKCDRNINQVYYKLADFDEVSILQPGL